MANEFDVEMECSGDQNSCSTVSCQDVDVCVPVTVKAYGEIGKVKTQCLGDPVVTPGCDHCMGKQCNVCTYTICQNLRIEIPVTVGAKAEAGEAFIDCGCEEI